MDTKEYVKYMISIQHRVNNIDIHNAKSPTTVYNDNCAWCDWAKTATSKCLLKINLCNNYIRECQQEDKTTKIKYIKGKTNCANIFTKKLRDCANFITLQDLFTWSRGSFLSKQVSDSNKLYTRTPKTHHNPEILTSTQALTTEERATASDSSLPTDLSLSQFLSTLCSHIDRLVPLQQDRVGGLSSGLEYLNLGINIVLCAV